MDDDNQLEVFIKRLRKIGIKVELALNYPWIYIDKINGQRVTELFAANHGFTIAFMRLRGDGYAFTDLREVFKVIRKYK